MVNGRPAGRPWVGRAACLGPWPGPTAWDDFFPRGAANLGHGSPRAATRLTQRRTREGAAHWCHFSTKGAHALNVGGRRQGWWWHWGSIMVSGAETARTSWGKSQARQRPRNADGKKEDWEGGSPVSPRQEGNRRQWSSWQRKICGQRRTRPLISNEGGEEGQPLTRAVRVGSHQRW
jgi:hypothetical protein